MVYPGFSKEGGINNGCLLSLYEHTFLFTKTQQWEVVKNSASLKGPFFKKLLLYCLTRHGGQAPIDSLILYHGRYGPCGPHATYTYVNNGGRQVTEKPFTSKWKKEMRDG